MDLLLDGLERWDAQANVFPSVELLVLITGRGPLREEFEQRLSQVSWRRVMLRTAFLDPSDYRELLGAAHLGFCLHRSSSGVDLPMKIIDLFGARTPACVWITAPVWRNKSSPVWTALTFRDSQEFALRMDELLRGFPDDPQFLEQMQRKIERSCSGDLGQAWQRDAAPVFERSFQALGMSADAARKSACATGVSRLC